MYLSQIRPKSQPICTQDSTGVTLEPSISVHLTGISEIGMFSFCAMYSNSTSNALKQKFKFNIFLAFTYNARLPHGCRKWLNLLLYKKCSPRYQIHRNLLSHMGETTTLRCGVVSQKRRRTADCQMSYCIGNFHGDFPVLWPRPMSTYISTFYFH